MNELQFITRENAETLEQIGPDLAETYKIAFAGPPWNEVSQCPSTNCATGLTEYDVGCACPNCSSQLVEAYNSDELIETWQTIIAEENGYMEVAYKGGLPQRATIARPTDASELFSRKYASVPEMLPWLENRLREPFVWIEDTFANRERQATGNLTARGETLERIATFYGGMQIATRTLSPAIISATLRDVRPSSTVYIGSANVGADIVNRAFNNPGYELPTVPDKRTLLIINQITRTRA